ncbi:hypothetical protein AB2K85_000565 [Escherichia coli]
MATIASKVRVHELDPFSGDLGEGVVLFSKDNKEYRLPLREVLENLTPHGFGKIFERSERLDFNSDDTFLEWVKTATPGRYSVYWYNSLVLPNITSFSGIIDVFWHEKPSTNLPANEVDKSLTFYSKADSNYEKGVYYCQYTSMYNVSESSTVWYLTDIKPVILTGTALAKVLSTTKGETTYFKYPDVGTPILAVYRGVSNEDKEIKIGLGDIVTGSRLGAVTLSCSISSTAVYNSTPRVSASNYTLPGRYMALSGHRNYYGTDGLICLFVRVE